MTNEQLTLLIQLGVPGLLSMVIGFLWRRVKATNEGLKAILRDRIIQSYNKYVETEGYCRIYAKQNVTEMYNQYHALGGNGTITKLYKKILDLPTAPPKKDQEE